jgi:hypothetical protein
VTALELLIPKAILTVLAPYKMKKPENSASGPGSLVKKLQMESQYFYKYWPYLSRTTSEVSYLMKKCKMSQSLADSALFLTINGFQRLAELYLPILPIGKKTVKYLQDHFNLAFIPHQITVDIKALKIRFNPLLPAKLRDKLKRDERGHCDILESDLSLLLSLLIYCTSDMHSKNNSQELELHSDIFPQLAGKIECD